MSTPVIYVIGGGLAGLSTAVALADKGARIVLFEAAGQAGGRCRSYFDAALDCVIDNGNHLVLSGNHAVMAYLHSIGARKFSDPGRTRTGVAFVDHSHGCTLAHCAERWGHPVLAV